MPRGHLRSLFITLFLFSLSARATPLFCQIKMNDSIALEKVVDTKLLQKVPLPPVRGISAYITEKAGGLFIAEMFIANYEIRIYAHGNIKNQTDQLISSLWGRDMMVDLQCSLAKKSRSPMLR